VYSLFGAMGIAANNWTPAFLSRVLELEIADVGYAVGSAQMVGGFLGFGGAGMLLDRLHARGVPNASYRYLMCTAATLFLVGPFAYLTIRSLFPMLAALAILYLAVAFAGAIIAHLQLVTPRAMLAQTIV